MDTTIRRKRNTDSDYDVHPTLVHEYEHHIDSEARWVTDGVWRTEAFYPGLLYRVEWSAI